MVFKDIDSADIEEATTQSVKKRQRLYQITLSIEALKILFDHGFNSAYDVVAFPYDVFLDRFGHRFPSREEARLVCRIAQQLSAVTYKVFAAANKPPIAFAMVSKLTKPTTGTSNSSKAGSTAD